MVRTTLPPGFRFHPTDIELILYYLKRKIMGRKFHYEAIGEVNIYRYSPWDLPDKSVLKSKDLEWFFLCPREKKYANGVRVKRATENGYWKTTGKERAISCNKKTVGYVKTLIFHLGHAPQGERTNWVMHEYRILDDQLAKDGVQDNYVLCKVYEKKGLGPKNGAQYGAPFSEADWSDDIDDDVAQSCSMPLAADVPCPTLPMQNEEQCLPLGTGLLESGNGSLPTPDDGSLSVVSTSMMTADEAVDDEVARLLGIFTDEDMLLANRNGPNLDNYVLCPKNGEQYGAPSSEADRSDNNVPPNCSIPLAADGPCPTLHMQNKERCLPVGTGLFGSRNGTLPIPEQGPSSLTAVPTDDDITRLLEFFVDEDMLLSDDNGLNQDDLNGNGMEKLLPLSEDLDLYGGIHELDISTGMNEEGLNFSGLQYVDSSLNSILSNGHSVHGEFDNLLSPLDFSDGVTGTPLSSLYQASTSYSRENMQQLYSGTSISGMNQYNAFSANDQALLPYTPEDGDFSSVLHVVDHQFYRGSNDSHNLVFPSRQIEKNAGYNMMERGSSGFENTECVAVEVTCGGSSIHIKAEVTHVAGECTYEALSLMMEGSSSFSVPCFLLVSRSCQYSNLFCLSVMVCRLYHESNTV